MRKLWLLIGLVCFFSSEGKEMISLPKPKTDGSYSVEKAIKERRSIRSYSSGSLSLEQISQLLWALQGITGTGHGTKLRAAPSAGALYPLEIYLIVGGVQGLASGVYKYKCALHELEMVKEGDERTNLCNAALRQKSVQSAAVNFVICGVFERTRVKYGDRASRYVYMEVGTAAENLYLQATALGLGTVFIGAFDDAAVKKVINAANDEAPLCVMPVGKH